MRLRITFLAALIASLVMFSCKSDDKGSSKLTQDYPNVSGHVEKLVSKATNDAWEANDAIGIFMVENGKGIANTIEGNVKYVTTAGDGKFTPAVEADKLYFPLDGSQVDFISYYPFVETLTDNKYAINVSDQTDFPKIDLLYSDNAKGHHSENFNVAQQFSHQLTKLVFNVAIGDGMEVTDLTGLEAKIIGMNTTAKFNLADATITDQAAKADIVPQVATNGTKVEAIIIPTTITDQSVVFTVGGNDHIFKFDAAKELKKGEAWTYTINLSIEEGDPVAVVVESNVIDNWTPQDGGSHDVFPEAPEQGGTGELDSPFTVSQLSQKIGETGWVEGYIVGSFSEGLTTRSGDVDDILIAEDVNEEAKANMVLIELIDPDINASLNLRDNEDLFGAKIKIKGTIAAGAAGVGFALNNVTDQRGGAEVDPKPEPVLTTIYHETFKAYVTTSGSQAINSWTGWDEQGVTYSAVEAELRARATYTASIWFPPKKAASFKVEGINTSGATDLKLSFEITCGSGSTSTTDVDLKVIYNGKELAVPSIDLPSSATLIELEGIDLSESADVEFTAHAPDYRGFRLNDIKIVGFK